MRTVLIAALLTFAGCPASCPGPVPTPIVADLASSLADCPAGPSPTSAEVCPGLFTAEGLACVRCASATDCRDAARQVYCASGGCADPRCVQH